MAQLPATVFGAVADKEPHSKQWSTAKIWKSNSGLDAGKAIRHCYNTMHLPLLRLLSAAALIIVLYSAAGSLRASPEEKVSANDVCGKWVATHPSWRGEILLNSDGTMTAPLQGPGRGDDPGRWTLASLQGTPLLVLLWDNWGTEALLMITPDYFRGQIKSGSFMEMRRDSAKKKEMKAN